MKQCELCGTEYQETSPALIPPCPECMLVACKYPQLLKWITKVANFTVERATWLSGEALYAHQRNKKHENNMHYMGFYS